MKNGENWRRQWENGVQISKKNFFLRRLPRRRKKQNTRHCRRFLPQVWAGNFLPQLFAAVGANTIFEADQPICLKCPLTNKQPFSDDEQTATNNPIRGGSTNSAQMPINEQRPLQLEPLQIILLEVGQPIWLKCPLTNFLNQIYPMLILEGVFIRL